MKRRCYNQKYKKYKNYGGKGVSVCDEWRNDFMAFYNWAINNGWEKGLHIDKDIKGGNIYSPQNCSIVTAKQNHNHTVSSIFIEHGGETHTISEWCDIYGIKPQRTWSRYRRGVRTHQRLFNPNTERKISATT